MKKSTTKRHKSKTPVRSSPKARTVADGQRLLSVQQFATLAGVSRATVYKLLSAGDLYSVRLGDLRIRRVPASELDRFIGLAS